MLKFYETYTRPVLSQLDLIDDLCLHRFLLVLGYWGYILSFETAKNAQEGDFGPVSKGLEKVIQEIQLSRKSFKMDKRLTGSSIIDEPLQEVLTIIKMVF